MSIDPTPVCPQPYRLRLLSNPTDPFQPHSGLDGVFSMERITSRPLAGAMSMPEANLLSMWYSKHDTADGEGPKTIPTAQNDQSELT